MRCKNCNSCVMTGIDTTMPTTHWQLIRNLSSDRIGYDCVTPGYPGGTPETAMWRVRQRYRMTIKGTAKATGTFLVGAMVAGYGTWQLKPSSVESLALSTITHFADAQAAADRATYEARLENAQASVEAATAAVAQSEYLRVEAENTARIARREADKAQALAAQSTARLHTFQEVVTVAQRAVDDNPTLDTMQGLIEAQALDIGHLTEALTTTQGALRAREKAYGLLQVAYDFQGTELTLSQQATKAATTLATLATERVEQLDGARVRWGPSVSVGCNLIGCSLKNITALVGVSLIYGR